MDPLGRRRRNRYDLSISARARRRQESIRIDQELIDRIDGD